jgi:hypothetical protein
LTTPYQGGDSLGIVSLRTAALGTALAIFGLGAAVGIGLAANSISGDSVGLSAEPLSAGGTLAPAPAADARRETRARRREAAARRRAQARRRAAETASPPTTTESTPTTESPPVITTPEVEPGDDDGSGRGRGRGRGGSGDDSGSGSDDSGGGGDD